jgi:hypothetical protein
MSKETSTLEFLTYLPRQLQLFGVCASLAHETMAPSLPPSTFPPHRRASSPSILSKPAHPFPSPPLHRTEYTYLLISLSPLKTLYTDNLLLFSSPIESQAINVSLPYKAYTYNTSPRNENAYTLNHFTSTKSSDKNSFCRSKSSIMPNVVVDCTS